MIRARRFVGVALLSVLFVGCAARPMSPAPEALAPWTDALSAQQPDDAFAAVYRVGRKHVIFLGSVHETDISSPTFKMIEEAFRHYRFDDVIVEGYPTSKGPNPARLLQEAAEQIGPDGFQQSGESVPTERGALSQGAKIWGGEPDDAYVRALMTGKGFSDEDLLGYYVLRVIPQWTREKKLNDAADTRLDALVADELTAQRNRLAMAPSVIPDPAVFRAWYARVEGKPLDSGFSVEETGPRADGPFPMNRIAAAISLARDAHLHELMVGMAGKGHSVLVVYGGSHLMIHRPALDQALGKPCYVGTDLRQSSVACG